MTRDSEKEQVLILELINYFKREKDAGKPMKPVDSMYEVRLAECSKLNIHNVEEVPFSDRLDKMAEEHGHRVLKLPPYHCQYNPIGQVWSECKRYYDAKIILAKNVTHDTVSTTWNEAIFQYGQTLGPYLSSYVLMATALDRHQAICYPLTYCSWTSRRSKAMMYAAWVASLLCCVPQVIIFSLQEVAPGVNDCWATFNEEWGEQAYVIWYSVSIFIVPLLVLVYTYTCICREIWRCSDSSLRPRNSTKHNYSKRDRAPLISRAKINTVKQTVAVILMYIACSAPFIVAQLLATLNPTSSFLEGSTFTILSLLYSLNSCVNPWIYMIFNKELPRLLIRHFVASNNSYRGASEAQTLSNSSGEQVTSLKLTRQSPGRDRHHVNSKHWMVTST